MKTEFSKWIGELPHKDYDIIRKKIIGSTGVTTAAYSMWYRGENSPSIENMLEIAKIAYQYNKSQPFARITVDREGNIHII